MGHWDISTTMQHAALLGVDNARSTLQSVPPLAALGERLEETASADVLPRTTWSSGKGAETRDELRGEAVPQGPTL